MLVASSSQISHLAVSKDGSITVSASSSLADLPILHAISYSSDNSNVLVATGNGALRLNNKGGKVTEVFKCEDTVKAAVIKGSNDTVYFCQGTNLCALNATTGKIKTIIQGDFCSGVTSMSISSDSRWLACISTPFWAVDLSNSRRHVLEGTHLSDVSACTFSPHQSDQLFAAEIGDLLIYKMSESPFPAKRVPVGDGKIISIACCPVNTTRLATIDVKGRISLVDIEKDVPVRKVYRTASILTTVMFSGSGAIVYAGTDKGQLLSCSLRQLSEEPKEFSLGGADGAICTMSLPTKSKVPPVKTSPKEALKSLNRRKPLADESNTRRTVSSPVVKRKPGSSPPVPRKSLLSASVASPLGKKKASPRRVVNPANSSKSPQGSQVVTAMQEKIDAAPRKPVNPSGLKTTSSSSSLRTLSRLSSRTTSTLADAHPVLNSSEQVVRPSLTARTSSRTSSAMSIPPSILLTPTEAPQTEPDCFVFDAGMSASPDYCPSITALLPSMEEDDTVIHYPTRRPAPYREPEVNDPQTDYVIDMAPASLVMADSKVTAKRGLRKDDRVESIPLQAAAIPESKRSAAAPRARKTSHVTSGACADNTPPSSSVGYLIKEDVAAMLDDLRQDAKRDFMGLHLDFIRLGRSWKTELGAMMKDHREDLTSLREENARLREENRQLRMR